MVPSRRSGCAIRHGSQTGQAAAKGSMSMQRLTDALDFQTQALVLRAERQRLIASNIANADTPGYVARDMDFARALREATGQAPNAGQMNATAAGHLQPWAGARGEPGL